MCLGEAARYHRSLSHISSSQLAPSKHKKYDGNLSKLHELNGQFHCVIVYVLQFEISVLLGRASNFRSPPLPFISASLTIGRASLVQSSTCDSGVSCQARAVLQSFAVATSATATRRAEEGQKISEEQR